MEQTKLRDLWLQSIILSDTHIGRDKSARAFQYLARMLFGITDQEVFGNLLRALALSRKTLRFWKPVKAIKRIEDLYADPARDQLDKHLTALEIGSDGVYAAIDHVTFLQRIGALKWMSPKQVDNLDRFLEFFWATEAVPVILRESRNLLRFGAQATIAQETDAKSNEDTRLAVVNRKTLAELVADKKQSRILLFKAICDFLCSIYFMQPLNFKNKRIHKTWCGLLGLITSLISLKLNWPQKAIKKA